MKKLSERAVVQYLSISAIAWPLHVLRGLYGSDGYHGGGDHGGGIGGG